MRRLPVYFLIDVSESMVGDPIQRVQDGMADIIKELRQDPYAIETVCITIIVFAGKVRKLISMEELFKFYPPKLPIGGGTSLGKAIEFLMNDINTCVKKTTYEEKGDWKPLVFLFTDGNPTDAIKEPFARWNEKYRNKANLVAISLGDNTDASILAQLTDQVLLLAHTDQESYKQFFKWITASISTSSMSITEMQDEGMHLAPLKDNTLSKIDIQKSKPGKVDENFAVILGRCQTNGHPYLIKYQKRLTPSFIEILHSNVLDYKLVGAYPIEEDYFNLADSTQTNRTISTDELVGFPTCPCCGNQYGFSYCSCGNIMCTGEEKISECPWCHTKARFNVGEGNINVNRTKG